MPRRTRRSLLHAVAIGAAGLLAGCPAGDDGTVTTSASTTPSGTATPPSLTPTATGTTVTPDDQELARRATELVDLLDAGDYEEARERFSPAVRDQVAADALEQAWTELVRQRGPLVEISGSEPTTAQGYRGAILAAHFAQGSQRIQVLFDAEGAVGLQFLPADTGEWTAPAYADHDAFGASPVQIESPVGCLLPAALTVSNQDSTSLPGVVIVGGSGPTDMDGTVGPNKPYKDLARGLASRGFAVLRYNKRTLACQVDPATLTVDDEVTDDARAALARLREHERVDPERVGVIGHSLGGMLVPRIAAREVEAGTPLVGAALLAAPARDLHRLVLAQTRYLAELDGTVTETEQANLDEVSAAVERVDSLSIEDGEVVLGGGRPYWESLQSYDPVDAAASLSTPLFLGQGERDYQVSVEEDLARYREALSGDRTRIETYPRLNHLFLPGEGQPTPSEYYQPGNVAEAVVADVEEWFGGLDPGE